MNATLFIARIFGLSMVIITTVMLLRPGLFKKVMADFSRNSALTFVWGLFAVIVGLAVILNHNIWAWNWTVIVTLLGWAGLVKGIWLLAFPGSVDEFFKFYEEAKVFPAVHAAGGLLFGLYLTYMGFFAG